MATWPDARSVSASFAFGHSQYEDPSGLTFETVSPGDDPDTGDDPGPVLDGFVLKRGRLGDAGETQTTSIDMAVRNDDGEFSPRNVTGPRYGTLRRGTWARLEVDLGSGPTALGTASALGFTPTRTGPDLDPQVAVQALGVLDRMGRDGVQASAMRRYYGQASPQPVAYWPLESGDQRSTFSFQSGLAGGGALNVVETTSFGVTRPFAAAGGISPGPLGAASATDTSAGGRLSGAVPLVSGATTARGEYSMLANGYENTFPGIISMYNGTTASDGTATRIGVAAQDFGSGWQIGVLWIGPVGPGGGVYAPGVFLLQDNEWHLIQLDLSSANGGADTAYVLRVDGTSVLSGTATGYAWLPITKVDTNTLATDVDRQAHLAVWSGTSLPTASDSYDAFLGNAGEAAHTRIASMCTAVGIPYTSSASDSAILGAQPTGTALAVLRDAEDADLGVLFERRDGRLTFQPTSARYNAAVALTLAYTDIPGAYPNDDDRDIYNRITLTRPDGMFATAEQTSGAVGSSMTTGIGPRPAAVPRNLYTAADLAHTAGWLLRLKTVDKPRFVVVVDLTAEPTLAASVLACDIGSRINVTGAPAEDVGPDDLDLIVEGEQITYQGGRLLVQWYCEPFEPWRVGELAPSDVPARCAGDAAAAIRADITSGATSIAFDPNLFRWASVLVRDTFTRSVSNDWGTPDIGSAWVAQTPSWYSVTGGKGKIVLSSADSDHLDSTTATYRDVDMWVTVTAPVTAAGASYTVSLVRVTDPGSWGNGYRLMAEWTTSGTVNLLLQSLAAGTLVTASAVTTYSPGDTFRLRFQIVGPKLAGKVWKTTVGEPDWQVAAVDTAETAGAVEIRVARNSGNTNANLTLLFDDLFVGSPGTSPGDFPMPVRLVHAPGIAGGGELVTVSSIATTEPTVVAAGAMSSADNTSVTPALYSGHTSGDWICVWAGKDGTGGTLTTPTGYTLLASQGKGYLWAKRHGSSESAPTITPSGGSSGDTVSAVTFGLRNMPTTLTPDQYVVDHAGQSNSSAQNVAYPGVAAGIQWGRVVLLLARKSDDDTGIAPPSGFTELVDATTTTGNDQSLWVGYRIDTAPAGAAPGVLTVTGGAAAISDTLVVALAGGYQTATVTRSTNSVVKAHSAGTQIAVETPMIQAL